MMNAIQFTASSVLTLGLFAGASMGEGVGDSVPKATYEITMRIYFTPFDIETYSPITMATVEKESFYTIWFSQSPYVSQEHPFIPKLRQLLVAKRATEEIDDNVIRLKVEFPNETFYVDQDGRVLKKSTGEKYKLSKKQLSVIEKDIVYFSGVVDIKATRKVLP